MFKTIVVGVDGREGGRDALALAGRLALLAGGELVAVRALPFDYYVARGGRARSTTRSPSRRRSASSSRSSPTPASPPARGSRRHVARPAPCTAWPRRCDADVIVVGSTRHGAVGRVLRGRRRRRHAARLERAPVAVAPRGLADAEWKPVHAHRRRLRRAPRRPQQALALAVALAPTAARRSPCRSVVAAPIAAPTSPPTTATGSSARRRSRKEQLDDGDRATCPSRPPARSPSASRWTSSSSSRRPSTCSCVGSRAWGPVRRTLIGSTAAKLMRRAHCPVLVLPRGAATGQPGEQDPARTEATTAA